MTRKKNLYLFFLFFLFFFLIFLYKIEINAQQKYRINDIKIFGNNTISDSEIEDYLNINKDTVVPADRLINLEEKLLSWGYFSLVVVNVNQVLVNSDKESNKEESTVETTDKMSDILEIVIQIEVSENLPVRTIKLENANIYLMNFKSKMKLKENKAFNPKFLEKDLQTLSSYPFVSRVSSGILENESFVTIEIYVKLKNQISSEISLSKFLFADFNYYFGKRYLPFYFSLFSFYPFESENYLPTFGASTGVSFFRNFYFNITFTSFYSQTDEDFFSNTLYLGFNLKGSAIKNENFSILFNPLSISVSYDLEKKEFNNTSLFFDSYFKFKKFLSFFLRSNLVYYFQDTSFFYGNVPNSGQQITLIYNREYDQFFYPTTFNSFVFRSEPSQVIRNGNLIFSSSFDILFKFFSTQILYLGLIGSFDFLFIDDGPNYSNQCFGIGFIFSISIKNILELPLTIQYFWNSTIETGTFYFTLLSKRFS
ncbi:MAG: hypothetical protein GYA61_08760 [Spirochaetales bacterium]|nr:hypothetical protein [Spirochaetales bacterium]